MDTDILRLIGVRQNDRRDTRLTPQDLRAAVESQKRRYDAKVWPRRDRLQRNINRLGDILKLDDCERSVLRVAAVASLVEYLGDMIVYAMKSRPSALYDGLAAATGFSRRRCASALQKRSKMMRCGFFSNMASVNARCNPLDLATPVLDAVFASTLDERRFVQCIVKVAPAPCLSMQDFEHLEELGTIQRYLARTRGKSGVNILLYGPPGTGKTEFVRTLAASVGASLYEVPTEDQDGDAICGQKRFSAYALSQEVLSQHENQMVLFDEVEDVFGQDYGLLGAMFGVRSNAGSRKGWVNELLESNRVPTLWVCNSIDSMDPAYLRRFDIAVEVKPPGRKARRRIVDRFFGTGLISEACAEMIASIEQLPPAQVERASKVVRAMKLRGQSKRDVEAKRVLRGSLKAMGISMPRKEAELPAHYDPGFLNCNANLERLTRGLLQNRSARLCLYGPPGTGKTAFAHHLAHELDMPLLSKRASTLLSKYVGETESRIAAAFEEAMQEGMILVIDEADSFLRNRSGARQSWEVTQVNELLTQMEAFDGIFIASTNLLDALDPAAMRRFDFKLNFDYLTRTQRRELVSRVCGSVAVEDWHPGALATLDQLDAITPGDVANAMRQCKVTGCVPDASVLVELLAAEQAIKPECRTRPIGFLS